MNFYTCKIKQKIIKYNGFNEYLKDYSLYNAMGFFNVFIDIIVYGKLFDNFIKRYNFKELIKIIKSMKKYNKDNYIKLFIHKLILVRNGHCIDKNNDKYHPLNTFLKILNIVLKTDEYNLSDYLVDIHDDFINFKFDMIPMNFIFKSVINNNNFIFFKTYMKIFFDKMDLSMKSKILNNVVDNSLRKNDISFLEHMINEKYIDHFKDLDHFYNNLYKKSLQYDADNIVSLLHIHYKKNILNKNDIINSCIANNYTVGHTSVSYNSSVRILKYYFETKFLDDDDVVVILNRIFKTYQPERTDIIKLFINTLNIDLYNNPKFMFKTHLNFILENGFYDVFCLLHKKYNFELTDDMYNNVINIDIQKRYIYNRNKLLKYMDDNGVVLDKELFRYNKLYIHLNDYIDQYHVDRPNYDTFVYLLHRHPEKITEIQDNIILNCAKYQILNSTSEVDSISKTNTKNLTSKHNYMTAFYLMRMKINYQISNNVYKEFAKENSISSVLEKLDLSKCDVENCFTAGYYAAIEGKLYLLKEYMEYGYPMNSKTLFLAVSNLNLECVNLLHYMGIEWLPECWLVLGKYFNSDLQDKDPDNYIINKQKASLLLQFMQYQNSINAGTCPLPDVSKIPQLENSIKEHLNNINNNIQKNDDNLENQKSSIDTSSVEINSL